MYCGLDEVFLDFSFGSKKETWENKIVGPMLKERLCDALHADLLLHALLMPNKTKHVRAYVQAGNKRTRTYDVQQESELLLGHC